MILSPYQFIGDFLVGETTVSYIETRELGQGGPTIGRILINGTAIGEGPQKAEFGGPLVICQGQLFAPIIKGSRFSLARIDLKSRNLLTVPTMREKLILIKSVDGETVFYYNDLENKALKSYAFHG